MIKHGLHALRDTLQQDKELTPLNTSLGIVGFSTSSTAPSGSDAPAPAAGGAQAAGGFEKFRILEGDELKPYLDSMDPKETPDGQTAPVAAAATGAVPAAMATDDLTVVGGDAAGDAPAAGGDSMETD